MKSSTRWNESTACVHNDCNQVERASRPLAVTLTQLRRRAKPLCSDFVVAAVCVHDLSEQPT